MSTQWEAVLSDKGKPWAWEIKLGLWRLLVVYDHSDYPERYVSLVSGIFGKTLLDARTEKDAKKEALERAQGIVTRIVAAIEEILNER